MISIQTQISKFSLMRARYVRNASAYSYQPSRSPNRMARELIDGVHDYVRQESVLIRRTQSYLNSRFNYYHDSRCHSRGNTRFNERGQQLAGKARSNMSHLEPNRQAKEDRIINKNEVYQKERDETPERLQAMEDRKGRAGKSKKDLQVKKIRDEPSKKSEKNIKREESLQIGTGNRSDYPKNRRKEEKSEAQRYEVVKLSRKQEQKQDEERRRQAFEERVLQEMRELRLKVQQIHRQNQQNRNFRNKSKKQVNMIPKRRPELKEMEKKSSDARQEEDQECQQKERRFQDHYNSSETYLQRYVGNRTQEEELQEHDSVEEKYRTTSPNMPFGANQSDQEVKEQLFQNYEINEIDQQMLEVVDNLLLSQSNRRIKAQKNLLALQQEQAQRRIDLQKQLVKQNQQRQKEMNFFYQAKKRQAELKRSPYPKKQKERYQQPKRHRDEHPREQ